MGKIIEFCELKLKNEPEGIQMYYKFHKTSKGIEREADLQRIAKDIGCKSCYDRGFLKEMTPQDALELIGYAAAKRVMKNTKATANYYKKLAGIIDKYGLEVIGNVKTN